MEKTLPCIFLVVVIFSPLIFLSINFACAAGTSLPSIISSDTTLTKAGGPYSLIGPTLINAGVTLTLEAGSTLNIGTYYLQVDGTLRSTGASDDPAEIISTYGTDLGSPVGYINFTGSCTNCIIDNTLVNQTRIYFANSSVKISSSTIIFHGSPSLDNVALYIKAGATQVTNNIIQAAVMTQGGTATISGNQITGGMGLYGGSPTVINNIISGHSTYFLFAEDEYRLYNTVAVRDDCSPIISGNDVNGSIHVGEYNYYYGVASITNNSVNGGVSGYAGQGEIVIINNKVLGGIGTSGSNVTIQGNQISGTGQAGISVSDGATVKYNAINGFNVSILVSSPSSTESSMPTIKNNNIQNWLQYCIKTQTSIDVDASNNWWGTTDIQTITASIYDQTYDFNLGKVNITPILNAPDPQAPEFLPIQIYPTSTPTVDASPSPTSTVPEYPTTALIVLLVAVTLAMIVSVRKLQNKPPSQHVKQK